MDNSDVVVERLAPLMAGLDERLETLEAREKSNRKRGSLLGMVTSSGGEHSKAISEVQRPHVMRTVAAASQSRPWLKQIGVDKAAAMARWFTLAAFAGDPQRRTPELYGEMAALSDALGGVQQKAAFAGQTDTMGGFTVPDVVAEEVARLIADHSVVRQAGAMVIPLEGSDTLRIPKGGAGAITVQWLDEAATITDSFAAGQFAQLALLTRLQVGRGTMSIQFAQDSPIGALDYVQTRLAEEIGAAEDEQALEGTGSPYTGLAGDADVNEIAAGTNGDPITVEKIHAVIYKARERASRRNAAFFVAPEAMERISTLRADAVTAADKAGPLLFQMGQGDGVPDRLRGFPVNVVSGIRVDRTKGTGTALTNIYFGPPQGIVIVERTGMTFEATTAVSWTTFGMDFRLSRRSAVGVAVPTAFTRAIDLETS